MIPRKADPPTNQVTISSFVDLGNNKLKRHSQDIINRTDEKGAKTPLLNRFVNVGKLNHIQKQKKKAEKILATVSSQNKTSKFVKSYKPLINTFINIGEDKTTRTILKSYHTKSTIPGLLESFVDIGAKYNWSGSTEFPFNKLTANVPPEVTTTQTDHLENYSLIFIDPYSTIHQGCGDHCQEHQR